MQKILLTEIAVQKNAKGFKANKKAAKEGESIAGRTIKDLEEKSGKKVVTSSNFLNQIPKDQDIELIEKE
jgi:hypothetical protein